MNKRFKIISIINIITILLSITLIMKPISVYAEPGEEQQNPDNNTNTETGGENTTPSGDTNTGKDDSNNNTTEENTEKKEETKPVQNTTNNNSSSNSNSNSAKKTVVQNTKSSNANLSNLGITPNDFSGFKETKTEYETSVPNKVTEVEVYATKKDSKASITGTGKIKLTEGDNIAKVVVTAEDGTTKTYTITIKRLKDGEKEETTKVVDSSLGLDELEIKGLNLEPAFSKNVYKYTVNYEGDEKTLEILAKSNQDNFNVEIIGNDNLINGQNLITILVSNAKESEIITYQITVNKNVISQDELNGHLNDGSNQSKIRMWIIIGLSVIIIIGIIAFFRLRAKKKKYKRQQESKNTQEKNKPYYYYDDENDKANVNSEKTDKAKLYEEIVKQSRMDRRTNKEIEIKIEEIKNEDEEDDVKQNKNIKKKGKHQRKH